MITIGVGLAAAIVAFLILTGFQARVKEKISSFSADLMVTKYTLNNSTEEQPIDINIELYNHPERIPLIDHIQEYSHKAGLIKTSNEVLGVIVKGVGKSFDLTRFRENMTRGRFINFTDSTYSNEIVLSEVIANKLNVDIGDDVIIHFFQRPPRFRKLKVVGLYETNLADYFDGKFIIGDIRLIQRLNDWNAHTAGGLQIFVKDITKIDEAEAAVNELTGYELMAEKISDKYEAVFDWLGLLSRQVQILLGIILIVICLNMVSIVMILVMERTQMIGVLKAMGSPNGLIRRVFFYNGVSLIAQGLLLGNVLGLGLCFLQYQFRFIRLNPRDYYMSFVPVAWDWLIVVVLNILFFLVIASLIGVLTALVSSVKPIKAIKFD